MQPDEDPRLMLHPLGQVEPGSWLPAGQGRTGSPLRQLPCLWADPKGASKLP
jgi:hypothetical protein